MCNIIGIRWFHKSVADLKGSPTSQVLLYTGTLMQLLVLVAMQWNRRVQHQYKKNPVN